MPNTSHFPLYDKNSHSEFFKRSIEAKQGNRGLLFERFFEQYDNNWKVYEENKKLKIESGKNSFLTKFASSCGDNTAIKQATLRQLKLAQSQNGDGKIYQLDGHFVTGMGNSHPVENGFSWHYTLGTPYLSGSMVKGLVRALIERYYQEGEDKADLIYQWFGSEDRTVDKSENKDAQKSPRDSQAGELIFFDAIPTSAPTLSVDIMTPHMKDWYAKGSEIRDVNSDSDSDKIPADWHNLTPIPFLAVKKADFLFTIGKRPDSNININDVFECLDNALTYLGAGAKTQTGYGYMSLNAKAQDDLQENVATQQQAAKAAAELAQAKANVSELHAELLDVIDANHWRDSNDTAKQHFTEALKTTWLERLELVPEDKPCAELMLEIANIHYATQIKNPDGKKVKPHQREWILRLLALLK